MVCCSEFNPYWQEIKFGKLAGRCVECGATIQADMALLAINDSDDYRSYEKIYGDGVYDVNLKMKVYVSVNQ